MSFPGDASGEKSAHQCRRLEEMRIQSLGLEDPLEKEMATYSIILAWKIPWAEEPGRLQSVGPQRIGHNWVHTYSYNCSQPSTAVVDFT